MKVNRSFSDVIVKNIVSSFSEFENESSASAVVKHIHYTLNGIGCFQTTNRMIGLISFERQRRIGSR